MDSRYMHTFQWPIPCIRSLQSIRLTLGQVLDILADKEHSEATSTMQLSPRLKESHSKLLSEWWVRSPLCGRKWIFTSKPSQFVSWQFWCENLSVVNNDTPLTLPVRTTLHEATRRSIQVKYQIPWWAQPRMSGWWASKQRCQSQKPPSSTNNRPPFVYVLKTTHVYISSTPPAGVWMTVLSLKPNLSWWRSAKRFTLTAETTVRIPSPPNNSQCHFHLT